LPDNRSGLAKVGFDSCDVDNNFATIGEKQFNIVRTFNPENFERPRKFWRQFAVFVEESEVAKENKLAFMVIMMGGRTVEIGFLLISGQ
jgi:hypothetical protein